MMLVLVSGGWRCVLTCLVPGGPLLVVQVTGEEQRSSLFCLVTLYRAVYCWWSMLVLVADGRRSEMIRQAVLCWWYKWQSGEERRSALLCLLTCRSRLYICSYSLVILTFSVWHPPYTPHGAQRNNIIELVMFRCGNKAVDFFFNELWI